MSGFTTAEKPVDWPKDLQKYDIFTNEEGMYELLFSSQQPKAKDFRRHSLEHVMFLMREILVKTTLSSLSGNIQHLLTINIMTCHIMLQGYKDVKGMLN